MWLTFIYQGFIEDQLNEKHKISPKDASVDKT